MLSKLYIENIAVIERAEIDFSNGFNVLTGETGAGKSILVDSINAVLGQRTSRELIRTGSEKAFVCAEFESVSPAVLHEIDRLGYETDPENGGALMLRREIRSDGRNNVRINDRPASISDLRTVGRLLINIHGQHENQALMSVEKHMNFDTRQHYRPTRGCSCLSCAGLDSLQQRRRRPSHRRPFLAV